MDLKKQTILKTTAPSCSSKNFLQESNFKTFKVQTRALYNKIRVITTGTQRHIKSHHFTASLRGSRLYPAATKKINSFSNPAMDRLLFRALIFVDSHFIWIQRQHLYWLLTLCMNHVSNVVQQLICHTFRKRSITSFLCKNKLELSIEIQAICLQRV